MTTGQVTAPTFGAAGACSGTYPRPVDEPLPRSELRVGLPVAYLGGEHEVLDWGQQPAVGVLRRGHPGRVWELHDGHHVLVHWVGLEDTDESQVVGFSTDESGEVYRGLAAITEDDYARRVEQL